MIGHIRQCAASSSFPVHNCSTIKAGINAASQFVTVLLVLEAECKDPWSEFGHNFDLLLGIFWASEQLFD